MAREQKRLADSQAGAKKTGARDQDLSDLTADLANGSGHATSPLIALVKLLARQAAREEAEVEHRDTQNTPPE
ncbi:MAG: hypothetical protein LC676_18995 [Loktanella sp.]|nr:hypothetical protein [Loktanella sp.]